MLLCVVSVDSTAVFDVAPVIDELRMLQSDSGWLMLVDGWHKLCDRDFTNATQLLEGGICICIMVLLRTVVVITAGITVTELQKRCRDTVQSRHIMYFWSSY